jgi:hypothetical protein
LVTKSTVRNLFSGYEIFLLCSSSLAVSQSSIIFSDRKSHLWPSLAIYFLANKTGFGSNPAALIVLFHVPKIACAPLANPGFSFLVGILPCVL